jgi:D-glycero-alpha-D-manno-heptose-7-phosphate kinase
VEALLTAEGYRLHSKKLDIAYRFREALRVRNWSELVAVTDEYREIRTQLCANYMDGAEEINMFAKAKGCAVFPLGAGGGGAVLIVASEPDALKALQADLETGYRAVPFRVMEKGHRLENLPLSDRWK